MNLLLSAGLVAGLAGPVGASSVFLAGDSNIFTTDTDNEVLFQNIFNGKSVFVDEQAVESLAGLGTTATETTGAVTSANLVGIDFLLTGLNKASISASELSVISSFVSGGGSLFLFGEGIAFSAVNSTINTILASVGSSMSLSTTSNFDNSLPTTFTATTATPFGNGVNSWTTSFASDINLGVGTAIISGTADAGTFGTAVAFEEVTGSSAAVPVPASLPLLASAFAAFSLIRRRRDTAH